MPVRVPISDRHRPPENRKLIEALSLNILCTRFWFTLRFREEHFNLLRNLSIHRLNEGGNLQNKLVIYINKEDVLM